MSDPYNQGIENNINIQFSNQGYVPLQENQFANQG